VAVIGVAREAACADDQIAFKRGGNAHLGTTENAVETQIWNAIATYVVIAIVKKRLNLDHSLYEILRMLDLNIFETTPISTLLGKLQDGPEIHQDPMQQTCSQRWDTSEIS
jgi:hypothetical protein